MLVICLAAASSLGYGIADFAGGLAARRAPVLRVTDVTLLVSLALDVVLLPVAGGRWSPAALLWGGASGLASAAASALLYRSLALGPMSVLSPVTAVVSAALPVAAGLAAGERLTGPGAAGAGLAVVAVVAVITGSGPAGRAGRPGPAALLLAVAAGAGIAAQLIGLSRSPPDSGIAPLIACRAISVAVLLPVAVLRGAPAPASARLPPDGPSPDGPSPAPPPPDGPRPALPSRFLLSRAARRRLGPAVAAGLFDAAANLAFLLAVRGGTLVIVAVIAALYPAGTVLLARRVLHERLTRRQLAGLAAAAAAVVILALS
jgi:drug/metabolite transporter (DMT)-like permease